MLIQGYRLLDLSNNHPPGATCGHLLADMGMEVIKVEAPAGVHEYGGESAQSRAYDALNRNKKSIVLNLKEPQAKNVLHRLVASADVLMESYRPGVTQRLGIDYESLKKINPGIIYCSISGYGQDGPYAQLAAHDTEASAFRGAFAKGPNGVTTPSLFGILLADISGGMHAALAILAALLEKSKTGESRYIDVALADSVSTFQLAKLQRYLQTGEVQQAAHLDRALLECKDGKYLAQANVEPHNWARFCKVIGREDFVGLPQEEYETRQKKIAETREIMLTKTRDEWFEELAAVGASVAPCKEIPEVFEDPQVNHRGLIWELDHPTEGKVKHWGFPVKFSGDPIKVNSFAPAPGENTQAILNSLGYSQADIDALRKTGVVA